MESKGTRSSGAGGFNTTVKEGYEKQVEPHLGHSITSAGTAVIATHGYCVGAYLTSPTKADLRIHHTAAPSASITRPTPPSLAAIQRHSYATAFRLAHSERLSDLVRSGSADDTDPLHFVELDWNYRQWIGAAVPGRHVSPKKPAHKAGLKPGECCDLAFALERETAKLVLRHYVSVAGAASDAPDIEAMKLEEGRAMPAGGYIFPDGLAVLTAKADAKNPRVVAWDRERGEFVDA